MSHMAIGDMSDERARMVLLRASYGILGVIPRDARRMPDGGYVLTLDVDACPDALEGALCGATVKVADEQEEVREVPCRQLYIDNIHRPDMECDDPAGHLEQSPLTLHHSFLYVPALPDEHPQEEERA